ncbi:MAG: S41 family peptidase [Patescibacteria group bacterium]|nr:S41 family peptidase [Patescibacteria group bacterium]MDD4304299.1 S41 family peptidase [Patescibacteria group bacterium]MDD4695674.1 S41 family peptidase [Patescibacteria group bacterium]
MIEDFYLLNKQKKVLEKKKTINIIIIISVIIISFFIGVITGATNIEKNPNGNIGRLLNKDADKSNYLSKDVNFKLFWEVWDLIREKYINQDITDSEMFYGAEAGLVASLKDPYSVFLPPDVSSDFNDELEGKFEGIGAEIGIKNDKLTVVAPLSDSPAEKAGIKAGDIILKIDDFDTTGISLSKAVSMIRGDKGTEVILKVLHKNNEEETIKINRDQIHYESVKWTTRENNIGYIQITHFNQDTEKLFDNAVNEVLNKNVNSIILDLRNNPGGYLSTAIKISSYWIEDGVIVKEQSQNKEKMQNYSASGQAKLKNKKTIVLVNGGSASASEIVAGALQDYEIAQIVGEKTFGKGSVQDLTQLSDGSSVKLTIAKWLTPKDRSINEEGIEPDITIELTAEDYNADRDPQMDKAIELLK